MPNNVTIAKLQDKSVNITSNGTTTIRPDTGYTAMHSVSVDVDVVAQHDGVINFYDYEGTLVASYTGAEVQALTALPPAPDHSTDEVPLTFEEWNWSLSDMKTYNTSYPTADINVGANYHTTDGKAHFYWNITTDDDGYGVEIGLSSSGGTVDWGDGSAVETITSITLTHIYTSIGEYHCIVDNTSTYYVGGSSSTRRTKREKLIKCFFPNTVTSVEYNSFANCYNLQSITIPNTVTSIRNYSFQYCYSLQSITIPSGVTSIEDTTFSHCYALQSIIIPNTVNIESSAFSTCYSLQSITIPSTVTSIKLSTFSSCYNLQSITIPNTVTSIGNSAFGNCYSLKSITIPNTVTSIGASAFNNCNSLLSITILSGVTSIGNGAFNNCNSLQSITIPNTVTSIGNNAFQNCYALQSITIPSTVTSIGNTAFQNCYALKSITIPSTVTSIGNSAFSECYSLYSVTLLATTPPTLGTSVFYTSNQKKIYVPYSADHSILAAYQSETNWSDYASIMEELPAS